MDGVENPCSSEQYGVGFPSLGNTTRLIPARLSMLDEKECYSSHLSSGWHGFPTPSLAQMRRVLHSAQKWWTTMKICKYVNNFILLKYALFSLLRFPEGWTALPSTRSSMVLQRRGSKMIHILYHL